MCKKKKMYAERRREDVAPRLPFTVVCILFRREDLLNPSNYSNDRLGLFSVIGNNLSSRISKFRHRERKMSYNN